jgi:uncharacterized zinc-type alcohol dehydrogenase-like protein
MVPGHEIIGTVRQVGTSVAKHVAGDIVGIGCMVDSCGSCTECRTGEEQFCDGMVATYSAYEKDGKTPTFGGYSTRVTVDENYVLKIPAKLSGAGSAPLLCAGITTYSPLRHWKVGKGTRVGVIGLGGLGHMGVKFAAAMGAEVTIFSTSEKKRADAKRLGANDFVVTDGPEVLARSSGKFDLILSTVSSGIDYDGFIGVLKRDGALVLLGVPDRPINMSAFGLFYKRRSVGASLIGGIRETQEMLDFCGENAIESDIELIPIGQVNAAYERILKSDVRYRFVIDMKTLR